MGRTGALKLEDLARRLAGRVVGDSSALIEGIAPLADAGPRDLSFLANPRYLPQAQSTRAAAILVADTVELTGRTLLVVADPYVALARALEIFHPVVAPAPGVSPSASVAAGCSVSGDACVAAGVVLGESCIIGRRSAIMAGAVLGRGVSVGDDTVIHPHVTIYDGCRVGNRVIVHAGAVIGSDGFGFARQGDRYLKIPQVGSVVIEDDVEIGANVTVDRATFGATLIRRGAKIDNLVQIGHNVEIGENTVLVAQVGISGSTRVGRGVTFAGQSGAVGHIEIGDGAVVGAKSAVTRDLPAGAFVIGHPAIDARIWKKSMAVFAKLPEMLRRLRRLEASTGGVPAGGSEDPDHEKEA